MRDLRSTALFLLLLCTSCSRARVESINAMNQGVELAQQKQGIQAIEKFERAAVLDPTNDQAFWNMAIVHMELQKYARAKDDLERAIALNPNVAGYHEKLGTVKIELKDWAAAKQALEKALSLEPGLFKAHYKLAQVLEQLDDEQNALKHYTDAIRKGPRFLEAYSALGRLYADLGYSDQAIQVLQSALQVVQKGSEEEASVRHILGTVYQQKRQFAQAIQEFRAALQITPGLSEAMFSLGWTYGLEGEKEEARRYLKKYVDASGARAPKHYVQAARDKLAELEAQP